MIGLRKLLAALALMLAPLPAFAQPALTNPITGENAPAPFGNPLADASTYRSQRGELSEARYRVRYEETLVERGGAPIVRELTIDVAPDWALARRGDQVTLHDYRLNRVFLLGANNFTTRNGMADIGFRVMERHNRTYLQRLLAAAAPSVNFTDACDAEAELGVAISGSEQAGVTEFRDRRDVTTLRCANRDIGSFTAGRDAAPPPAFWPTMFAMMITHPDLHAAVRATGHAPAQMETLFRQTPEAASRRSWRLIAVETVAVAYPLDASWRNTTADALDTLIAPGATQLAQDAIAGRAQGGAPTLESWSNRLRAMPQAEAAMLIMPTLNMFPELDQTCASGQSHIICDTARNLRTIAARDPAPLSLLEIGMAEQARNPTAALEAMQRAQASPQRDHPALAASFALALLRFNEENLTAARAANLPTDVAALQNRAVLAFPYNPAYWTDIGDRYAGNYDTSNAFLLYDIAYALPMPSALSGNRALAAKRLGIELIRRDFPAAWSLTAP